MRIISCFRFRFLVCLALAGVALVPPAGAARAATCPFISDQQLAGAMPGTKWSLISDQDGRACIYTSARGDTLMLRVFRNPTPERAKELYAQFVKTQAEAMPVNAVSGLGEEAQAGATAPGSARPEASIMALSGDYVLWISIYRAGRPADALVGPLAEMARRSLGNVANTSEKFGGCEWLNAADAEGFLDTKTLTIQRTGANSCLMFDGAANSMVVAVITLSPGTQREMMNRNSSCKRVPLPELGANAFGEHSCTGGNANAVNIYVWKNGRQASVLFAPTKPHPESGSVEHLKAVAARVSGKL
jgi:hypothetical protein